MCMYVHSKGICNGTQILICAVCNLTKDISDVVFFPAWYSNLFFFFFELISFCIRFLFLALDLIFSFGISLWVIEVSKMNEYAIKIRCFW